jgi:hypothetical protein
MIKSLAILILVAAALYAAVCVLVYATQRSQIYYPTPESHTTAATAIRLPVDGADLKIWNVARDSGAAVIYFGGNAEDVGANAATLGSTLPDRSLYLVNYRGYGGSSGSPDEKALFADALEVFEFVAARNQRVAVIGRSLGAGVAAFLAANRPVEKVVLITPFDNLAAVAASVFPYLPLSLLITDRFDSLTLAPRITAPTLVIIAANDEIIGRSRTDALIAGFSERKPAIAVIPDAGHNDLQNYPEFGAALDGFFHRGTPERAATEPTRDNRAEKQ